MQILIPNSAGRRLAGNVSRRPGGGHNRSIARRAPNGFTLIELMVVVVLVGIMTALIIPEMKGTYEDALLRSTSRKLVSALNLAYSQAVSANQPHRLRIDKKNSRYSIERSARESDAGGSFLPLKNVPGSEGQLDSRISIEIRKQRDALNSGGDQERSAQEEPDPSERDVLEFYPDGTADRAEIQLKDRDGFRIALQINPTTARVRIIELERE